MVREAAIGDGAGQRVPREEIWIDYVADIGDGWNPAYAVARTVCQFELPLRLWKRRREREDVEYRTQRHDVLVFGGDVVYPFPSRREYALRAELPYAAALRRVPIGPDGKARRPHIFALPGNHDWYDNLTAFTQLFMQQAPFGNWRTRQSRSYFALKLPHGWWLLGTDVSLAADIDAQQLEFFHAVRKQFGPDDRVIACLSEPQWVVAAQYGEVDDAATETNMKRLEGLLGEGRVRAFVAGDWHHYRRHEKNGVHKITAGGGGAFLHPTHEDIEKVRTLKDGSRLVEDAIFPPLDVSRKLAWRNLGFAWLNPGFGPLPALLYVLTAWIVGADLDTCTTVSQAVLSVIGAIRHSPGSALWLFVLFTGFVLFTDTHYRTYRVVGGLLHAASHMGLMFVLAWWASRWALHLTDQQPTDTLIGQLLRAALLAAGGWVAGSTLMGLYLLISINVFGRHSTEAFSSLRNQDWKNFLRLHIAKDGSLTIYPIGLERVPRRWKKNPDPEAVSAYDPTNKNDLVPVLIEKPIRVERGTLGPSPEAEQRRHEAASESPLTSA